MTGLERRWARHLLAAFAPEGGPGLAPLRDEVDYESTFGRMMREATPLAALGLRLAIWMAALAPVWLWGKLSTISKLAGQRRTQLLRELLGHRVFAVRELALLLKLCAATALLGTTSVRARSGYDHVQPASKAESGVRVRLPIAEQQTGSSRTRPGDDQAPDASERKASQGR